MKKSSNEMNLFKSEDLKRTQRVVQHYWEEDALVRTNHITHFNMKNALSQLNPTLRESFKSNVLLFIDEGDYAQNGYLRLLSALRAALTAKQTNTFTIQWISLALKRPGFHKCASIIRNFLYSGE